MFSQQLLGTAVVPYFQIYQSEADDNFYWRLLRNPDDIIATGHQRYRTPEEAREEINILKRIAPSARMQPGIRRE